MEEERNWRRKKENKGKKERRKEDGEKFQLERKKRVWISTRNNEMKKNKIGEIKKERHFGWIKAKRKNDWKTGWIPSAIRNKMAVKPRKDSQELLHEKNSTEPSPSWCQLIWTPSPLQGMSVIIPAHSLPVQKTTGVACFQCLSRMAACKRTKLPPTVEFSSVYWSHHVSTNRWLLLPRRGASGRTFFPSSARSP